jgi:pimeloyl-ACP methyl ester carboxylesterase
MFRTLAVVLVLAGCGGGSRSATAPAGSAPASSRVPAPIPSVSPGVKCLGASPSPGAEVVRFPSPNGASLGGVLLGAGSAGVVLAHQSPGDLCDWWFYAVRLAGLGYRVLAFDLNGNASSSPSDGNPGHAEFDVDVLAAAGALRERGVTAIVAMGASLGGTAVVTAASEAKPPLAGVVDLSGPTQSSGMDALAAARKITVPALFITAERDTVAGETQQLSQAVTSSADHRLLVVKGSGQHGVALLKLDEEPQAPQVRAAIEDFLAKCTRR